MTLELLEERATPASFTWQGGGGDNLWSNDANWQGNVAPTGADDDIHFPATAFLNPIFDIPTGTFKSIAFSGSNYTIGFDPLTPQLTLGATGTGAGDLINNLNSTNNTVAVDILLNTPVTMTVGTAGASLTISGRLSGAAANGILKTGSGTLILSGSNTGLLGPINVQQNVLQIQHANALGAAASGETTIQPGTQLQLSNVVGGAVPENVRVSGTGISDQGAILNVAGANLWSGNIVMDSPNVSLGINAGALDVSGVVSDTGTTLSPHNLTKVGTAPLTLSGANTFKGLLTIDTGRVIVSHPQALGASGLALNGTITNNHNIGSKFATLEISSTGTQAAPFTITDEQLILNGTGVGGTAGALVSSAGYNVWAGSPAGDIILAGPLGSTTATSVDINVAGGSTLVIASALTDPNQIFPLTKSGTGELVLARQNTYRGTTTVNAGTVTLADSQGLGVTTAATTVLAGATVKLQVDSSVDSVTGTTNTLNVPEPITLAGTGAGNVGALYSATGINIYSGPIILNAPVAGAVVSIGVDADAGPTANLNYFSNDDSLTITGGGLNNGANVATLGKVGTGHLILPSANPITGPTHVFAGWITMRHLDALGAFRPLVSERGQTFITVDAGAAVHAYPTGPTLNLFNNFNLAGTGFTHPFALISNQGALQSLQGDNTFPGIMQLNGTAGIGALDITAPAATPSLILTGQMEDGGAAGGFTKLGPGRTRLQGHGTFTGPVDVPAGVLSVETATALGEPSVLAGVATTTTTIQSGAALEIRSVTAGLGGGIAGGMQFSQQEHLIVHGPGHAGFALPPVSVLGGDHLWRGRITLDGATLNGPGQPTTISIPGGARLTVSGVIDDSSASDLTIRGGGALALGGSNTYRGVTYVKEGTLTVQHPSALGAGGTGAGTEVSSGASLHLEGDITVAGEPLVIDGQGTVAPTPIATRGFGVGPAPITNALINPAPQLSSVSGPVTDVLVDRTDPTGSTIYIGTIGGGVWKTLDGGNTWRSLTDQFPGTVLQTTSIGSIAIDPRDPHTLFVGTGGNISSSVGRGVYMSSDGGNTWTHLVNPGSGTDPLDGKVVFEVVADPIVTGMVYAAVGDPSFAGTFLSDGAVGTNNGIWRFTPGVGWTNLTAGLSNTDAPINAFQQTDQYTDLEVIQDPRVPANRLMWFAIGNQTGAVKNAVYTSVNGGTSWTINTFGTAATAGLTQLAVATPIGNPATSITVYASSATTGNALRNIQVMTMTFGGAVWAPGAWAATGAQPADYLSPAGNISQAIVVDPTSAATVYVAGSTGVFRTTNSGGAWTNITQGSTGAGAGLGQQVNDLGVDATGRAIAGGMQGVWRLSVGGAAQNWSPLNTNLQLAPIDGLAGSSTDPFAQITGGPLVGVSVGTGGTSWNQTLNLQGNHGSTIRRDPVNPNRVYAVEGNLGNRWDLYQSIDGGQTWTSRYNITNATYARFPFALDSLNSNRIVFATNGVFELLNPGPTQIQNALFNAPDPANGGGYNAVAVATYQGTFIVDPGFASVTDRGSSAADPDTIYVATANAGANRLFVTKNRGITWVNRSTGLPANGFLRDIVIDPRNRDTAYVVYRNRSPVVGPGKRIFRTTDAGQSWSDITGDLPDLAIFKVVIDPRNNRVYVATESGVFRAVSPGPGAVWTQIPGLPNAQVHELLLNQTTNTLTAGVYGRGSFVVWLDDTAHQAGALHAISGSAIWSGDITITGATTIAAGDPGAAVDTVTNAQLTLLGAIQGNFDVTKVGNGTVTLAGNNVNYGGKITVAEGALIAGSPNALGQTGAGQDTVVNDGAALWVQSSINGEPLSLQGVGVAPPVNGHDTGALRNLSGNNTYSGPITLLDHTSIGVASGTTLTIGGAGGSIGDGAGSFDLKKELTGTLVFANANTYDGTTTVAQGILNIRHANALGASAAGNVFVDNGAALQLEGNIVVDSTKALFVAGTGPDNSGGLKNQAGNNTWPGAITFLTPAGALTATTVGLGAASFGDTLTINGVIDEAGPVAGAGLAKYGPGRVVLTNVNTYQGGTQVHAGTLAINNPGALGASGSAASGTVVNNGGALELQGGITVNAELLTINGLGDAASPAGALNNTLGNGSWLGPLAIQTSSAIGATAGQQLTVSPAGGITDVNPLAPGSLTKVGSGSVVLTTANSYVGQTIVSSGVLIVGNAGALGGAAQNTTVSAGATLQLGNGVVMTTETVRLNGLGAGGAGALTALGSATWNAPVILDSDASFGAALGNTLNVNGAVSENPALSGRKLTKLDAGTVAYNGSAANTYTGTTQVDQGTLLLNMTTPATSSAFGGPLVIGGGAAPARVDWNSSDQLAGTPGTVTVNGNGSADLKTFSDTIPNLTINGAAGPASGGQVLVDAGTLTVNTLGLTGNASLGLAQAGVHLHLAGAVNAQSNATGTPVIANNGSGGSALITLTGGTFNIASGGAASGDLSIRAGLASAGPALTKLGAGRLVVAATFVYSGSTDLQAGTLQADGSTGAVSLNGGTLTGSGTVASIAATAAGGTIVPGNVGTTNYILTVSGNVTLNAAVTLSIPFVNTANVLSQHKLLSTGGSIDLGSPGAALAGTYNNVQLGDTFTFVEATGGGTVLNTFATSSPLYISGRKVSINYLPASPPRTRVELQAQANEVTLAATLTSTVPIAFGQPVTLTFSAAPDSPLSAPVPTQANTTLPATPATFTVNWDSGALVSVHQLTHNQGLTGLFDFVLPTTPASLSTVGTHNFVVTFQDASGTFDTTGMVSGSVTINSAFTATALTSSHPTGSVFGQGVTFTAVVTPDAPGGGTPSGTIDFYDGSIVIGSEIASVPLVGGQATTPVLSNLLVGNHAIIAVYRPDTVSYVSSQTSLSHNVARSNTATTVSAAPSPSVFGQAVVFTANVTPVLGSGTRTGTVTFYRNSVAGGNILGAPNKPLPASGSVQSDPISTLAVATHNIIAVYSGDANFNGSNNVSSPFAHTVAKSSTTTTVLGSTPSSFFGEGVTFTATVAASGGGVGTPTGNVQFYDGDPSIAIPAATLLATAPLSGGSAVSPAIASLLSGAHSIFARYVGNTNFLTSDGSTSLTVNTPTTITSVTGPTSPVFGETVTYTATISISGAGAGTPGGTVQFFDGATPVGGPVTLSGGQAVSAPIANLAAGPHTITAQYTPAPNTFAASSGNLAVTVGEATSATSVASSSSTSVYGQSVTFTATVTAVAPGSGMPTGQVKFWLGAVGGTQLGTTQALAGGQGSVIIVTALPDLGLGGHTIVAEYIDDTNFLPSTGSLTQTVTQSPTSTALVPNNSSSVYGQGVTFTATVSATGAGSGTPTGTVDFYDTDPSINPTAPLLDSQTLVGGSATSAAISSLTAGFHNIFAVYRGDVHYTTSTGSATQNVAKSSTATSVNAAPASTVFGQNVTFTATITATGVGSGTPAGTVQFYRSSATAGNELGGLRVVTGGQASLTISSLLAGNHTIIADYRGDANFLTSVNQVAHTVNQSNTAPSISSSANPSVFGQSITFTVNMAATGVGSGTPTGTVTFFIGATPIGSPKTLAGGQATSDAISSLPLGLTVITVNYSGDSNFLASSGNFNQNVNAANTTVSVLSSQSPSGYGSGVSFTATVAAAAPGSGTPSGTVNFYDGPDNTGTLLNGAPIALVGGQATSPVVNTLTGGSHNIFVEFFSSTANFNSGSGSGSQVVTPAATTSIANTSQSPTVHGEGVTFTILVNFSGPATPTGTVTFRDGATGPVLDTKTLTGASATSNSITTQLAAGLHTIVAIYDGDANYQGSTAMVSQQVDQAATNTGLTASPPSSVFGQGVVFTATVTANAPGSGTPTGSVTFEDITGPGAPIDLGTVALSGGSSASASITSLAAGNRTIRATYNGSSDYTGSNTTLLYTVNQSGTDTALSALPAASVIGEGVVFTAVVSAAAPGAGTPTGSVLFEDITGATVTLETVTLVGGSASTQAITNLQLGNRLIRATYSSDANFSTSNVSIFYTVSPSPTNTVLAATPTSTVFGEAVTFTATVSAAAPGGGTPTGSVTFEDVTTPGSPVPLGSAPLMSGVATSAAISSLPTGPRTIRATYSSDPNYQASIGSFTYTVNQASTTTAFNAAPISSVSGQGVTFTATVSPVAPGAGTPSGTVTFEDVTTPGSPITLGSATLSGGVATSVPLTNIPTGSRTIRATYSSDSNFSSSSADIGYSVAQASTTTAVAPTSSVFGEAVAFSATISPVAPGGGTPTGSVTFEDITTPGSPIPLGTAPVIGGVATSSPQALAGLGTHNIRATYNGDVNFITSTGNVSHTVSQASSNVALAGTPPASVWGQGVSFTATVSATAPGSGTPTGTVTFEDITTPGSPIPLGSAPLAGGQASSPSTTTLAIGAHTIRATYSGDGNFIGNTGSFTYTVSQAPTSTALAGAPTSSVFGQGVTFTATVSVPAPGAGTPTGTVTFEDVTVAGSPIALGTAPLSGGMATSASIATLPTGTRTIRATYSSDTNFQASSVDLAYVVAQAATTTSFTTAPSTSVTGQGVTFTATVGTSGPGAGTPTGSVAFEDVTTPGAPIALGSATLSGGVATSAPLPIFNAGTRTIRATYSSDANFSTSSFSTTYTVSQASTSTTLSAAPTPSTFGQPVTFTATVSAVAPGGGTPTGTVNFVDVTTPSAPITVASANLVGGVATSQPIGSLQAGARSIRAVYIGSANYAGSNVTIGHTVNASSTSISVVTSGSPTRHGEAVTFTATVSAIAPGAGTPTGFVTFLIDGAAQQAAPLANGQASITTRLLSAGPHSITASYAGTAEFLPSGPSAAIAQQVNTSDTTTTLTAAPNPSVFGQLITFTATIGAVAPGSGVPTGTVTFVIDGNPQTPATVSSGAATFSISTLALNGHSISASYSGDANFNASGSATLQQQVNPAATLTALAAAPAPTKFGEEVAFTATVEKIVPGTGVPSGTITFSINGVAQAPVTMAGGQATFRITTLAVGDHTVTASYSGDGNFLASNTTAPLDHQVEKSATGTTVVSSDANSDFGQSVTFTATVSAAPPGAGTPTGTVTFRIDGVPVSPVTMVGGQASLTVSTLDAGPHTVTATYNGDASFIGNASAALAQQVAAAGTTTTLGAAPAPSVHGQTVTFTATVAAVAPGAGTPTGSVTFTVNGTAQPAVLLVNGQATLTLSSLAAATTHNIQAAYTGSSNFQGSTSASLSHTVNQSGSSVALSTSGSPSVSGQSVTFTATVAAAAPGSGTPTGSVIFYVDGTPQQTVPLNTGSASFTTAALALGVRNITADYSGDANFVLSSTATPLQQTVNQAGSAIALAASANPSAFGQMVTITATVNATAPGSGAPTGSVTFVIAGNSTQVPLSGNQATLTLPALAVGQHSVNATYSGDARLLGSAAAPLALTVTAAATATALAATPVAPVAGQGVTLTATVSTLAPGTGTPTGTVTFIIDGAAQTPVTLSNGQATLALPSLATGSHQLQATFNGSTSFAASSTSAPLTYAVAKAATSTTLQVPVQSTFGQPVTFTATISVTAPGGGAPGGGVTFTIDGVAQAPVNVSGGQASLTTATLAAGPHDIQAIYNGGADHQGSSSTVAQIQVNTAATTTALTSSADPSRFGQQVTFTATVSSATGTPDGSVTFIIDGTAQTPALPLTNGTATFSSASLAAGAHDVQASYAGNSNFGGSSSATLTQDVDKADTTTTLSSSLNPSIYGQSVTLTASVAAVAPGAGTPAGTVTFTIDGNSQSAPVQNGQATLVIATLSSGPHSVSAAYVPAGADFNASSSTGTFTQTVNKSATTTTVSSSANPSVFGQGVTFTATVAAAAPGGGTPTGQVIFTVDGSDQPVVVLAGGQATFSSLALSVGNHVVTARFLGDVNFNTSAATAPVTQQVRQAATNTAVTASANPTLSGQAVTFTATVTAQGPGAGTPTGSVTFVVDGTPRAPVALVNGQATLILNNFGAGTHPIRASYSGEARFASSATAADLVQTINQADTTTTVTSSAAPAVVGQLVTLTATVTPVAPGGLIPTGEVIFTIDGVNQAPIALDAAGKATFASSTLARGSHTVTASYGGSAGYKASATASTFTQLVNQAASSTTLNVVPSSSVAGQAVTITATVAASAPGAGQPTGQLTFVVDGVPQSQAVTLTAGQATLTLTSLSPGSHTFGATYGGNADFQSSSAAAVAHQVSQAGTTVVLASINPAVSGQTVTVTATVAVAPPGTGTPTGAVTFTVNGQPRSPVNLVAGKATLDLSGLAVGSHTISASYAGDAKFNGSLSSLLTQVVNEASTSISLVSSAAPALFGQAVTFTATVTPVSPGSGTPTGALIFQVNGVAQAPVSLDAAGKATLTLNSLAVGSHQISASYAGDSDGNFKGSSTQAALQQLVNKSNTATTVASSAAPSVVGQAVTFTATVASSAPGGVTPTGTVTFTVDGAPGSPIALTGGQASLTIATLPAGPHTVRATYSGSAGYNASTSPDRAQTVHAAATTTTLTTSAAPAVFGQAVTITATVAPVAPGAGTPTGKVTFSVDGIARPDVDVVNGKATLALGVLPVGDHTITATYNGVTSFAASTAASLAQRINQSATATTLTSSATPALYAQTVTITATVSPSVPGGGTPTGTVTFSTGASVPLTAGQATITLPVLAVGSHNITATYSGDAGFTASTSAILAHQVNKAGSSIALGSSAAGGAVFGQAVTFTATVTATAPGGGTPTGPVTFTIDGVAEAPVNLDAGGRAALTRSNLSVGNHTVSASYGGEPNFIGSAAPATLAQAVNGASTTTALAATAPSVFGQNVTFTATVSPLAPGSGTPTGRVTFVVDGVASAPVALSGGQATFTTSTLATGLRSVTATYSSDSTSFKSSATASARVHTVNPAATATALVSSANPSVFGELVTITATVAPVAPGAGIPTGTVTFSVGGVAQSPLPLSGGKAVLTLSGLALGSQTVTATYSGEARFASSVSASLDQVVNQAQTSTSVASSASTSAFGQAVTFTATVAPVAPGSGTPAGSVTFVVGNEPPTQVALVNGQARLTISTLGAGQHTVVATYNSDVRYLGSSSTALTQTVSRAATSVGLSASASPSSRGAAVTFTATVSTLAPGGGTPAGNLTFSVDGTMRVTVALVNGQAMFSASDLAQGTRSIAASYAGNADFQASSTLLSHLVTSAASAVTVSASTTSGVFGQPVIFTATVISSPAGLGTPQGEVAFVVDGVPQAPVTLNAGGTATLSLGALGVGSHRITADYRGAAGVFLASSSAPVDVNVTQGDTATTIASSASSAVFGQSVTVTATVAATAPAAGTPTGQVTFLVDGTPSASVSLVNGQATFSLPALSVGTHAVTAQYGGSISFAASSSAALSQQVAQASSNTTLTTSVSPSLLGDVVTVTVNVAAVAPGAGTPTGTVTVSVDGTAGQPVALSSGQAVVNLSGLAVGARSIVAAYSGDASFSASTSAAATQQVNPARTTTNLSASTAASVFGQPVIFTATVSADTVGLGTPTGSITFVVDGVPRPAVPLDAGGKASLTLTTLAPGFHQVTASYAGSTSFQASTETLENHLVNRASSATALTTSALAPVAGSSITFTAALSAVGAATGVPTGSVIFSVDGSVRGTVALDATGKASLTLSDLTPGAHTVIASYSGDANFEQSSLAVSQSVTPAVANVSLNSVASGQSVSLTATVNPAPGAPMPTGTVTFLVDGQPVGSANVVNGRATFTTPQLSAGSHTFSAVYSSSGSGPTTAASNAQVVRIAAPGGVSPSSNATRLQVRLQRVVRRGTARQATIRLTALTSTGAIAGGLSGRVTFRVVRSPRGGRITGPRRGITMRRGTVLTTLSINKPGTYVVRFTQGRLRVNLTLRIV